MRSPRRYVSLTDKYSHCEMCHSVRGSTASHWRTTGIYTHTRLSQYTHIHSHPLQKYQMKPGLYQCFNLNMDSLLAPKTTWSDVTFTQSLLVNVKSVFWDDVMDVDNQPNFSFPFPQEECFLLLLHSAQRLYFTRSLFYICQERLRVIAANHGKIAGSDYCVRQTWPSGQWPELSLAPDCHSDLTGRDCCIFQQGRG